MSKKQMSKSRCLHPVCSALRAFEVHVRGWPDSAGIYAATQPSKAKYQAWRGARSAGYDSIKFGDLRVRRSPQFDPIAEELARRGRGGVNHDHARFLMQNDETEAQPPENQKR